MAISDRAMAEVVAHAAKARGRDLSEHATEEYIRAFRGLDSERVRAAFSEIFRTDPQGNFMPPVAAVRDVLRRNSAKERGSREAADPKLTDTDRRFALAYGPVGKQFAEGKITQGEYAAATLAIARNCGVGPEAMAKIEEAVRDWIGSDEWIGKAVRFCR